MKKIVNFALALALLGGFASCSKEAGVDGPGMDAEKGKFTFVLPAQGGVVTYAGEVAASANEKKLDLTKTSIFMFSDDDNTLEAIIPGTDITAGTNPAGKPTATIEIIDGWEGDKTFYIVGNTDQGADASLATAVVGTTTTTQFQDLITDSQGTTLISSANGLLLAGNVPVANIEQTPSSDVTLYRSVARFDVNQDITLNKVKIKSIDVINANLNGYIDAYGRGVKTSGLTKGDLNNIAVSQTTVVEDVAGVDHTFQKQESVFYLYPTKLKANNAAGTEILLVGEVNGVEAIYTLNKEASDLVTDCEILANTRYIISAIDVLTHTFTITVAEWNEGEALIGRPDNTITGFVAGSFIAADGNTIFYDVTNTFQIATTGADLSFELASAGSAGFSVSLEADTNNGFVDYTSQTDVQIANGTLTYAKPYFTNEVTIKVLPGDINAEENFLTLVTFTDQKSGKKLVYRVFHQGTAIGGEGAVVEYYPGTSFEPVVVGGVTWAPVNVGQTKIDFNVRDVEHNGFTFQFGRNLVIKPGVTIPTIEGPITEAQHASGIYDNYFITKQVTPYCWCETPIQGLWKGDLAQGPCPKGWRVPTKEECSIIGRAVPGKSYPTDTRAMIVEGDNGDELYIPVYPGASRKDGIYGIAAMVVGSGQIGFWSSDLDSENAVNVYTFQATPYSVSMDVTANQNWCNTMPVRCVKDVQP